MTAYEQGILDDGIEPMLLTVRPSGEIYVALVDKETHEAQLAWGPLHHQDVERANYDAGVVYDRCYDSGGDPGELAEWLESVGATRYEGPYYRPIA